MQPEISVIIPVYNLEKYIKKSIDSVLKQTYKKYELLLVDDGSEDSSGIICDEYASKYENIRVIHKENKGLSDTRNVGIQNAIGKYLYFLDGDDYIIPECLEILYENLYKNNADISCGNFTITNSEEIYNNDVDDNEQKKAIVYDGRSACISLLYGKVFYTSSCNFLIKKEIAVNNLFPIGRYHEDELTTYRYFLSASKVVKTSVNTYYYYQRDGSIMHKYGQPVIDELFSADNYVIDCDNRNLDKKIKKAALCKKYDLYLSVIENYPELKEHEPLLYKETIKFLSKKRLEIIFNPSVRYSLKKRALRLYIED